LDLSLIWKAVIALGGLALLFGILLAIASVKFQVKTDPRLNDLIDALPGSNCGACGFPGCEAAAQAVLDGKAGVDVCLAGGANAAKGVAAVMGVDTTNTQRGVALVHCKGGLAESAPRAIYQGIDSCAAMDKTGGGSKACQYGCLGLGTCRDACPVPGAIEVTPLFEGTIEVDTANCPVGCDHCVASCPTNCFTPLSGRGVDVDARHCICCGACLVACFYGAIDLTRLRVLTDTDGYSAVWSRAIDRLLTENRRYLSQSEGSVKKLTELIKDSRL